MNWLNLKRLIDKKALDIIHNPFSYLTIKIRLGKRKTSEKGFSIEKIKKKLNGDPSQINPRTFDDLKVINPKQLKDENVT